MMMGFSGEKKLVDLLLAVSDGEREIEKERQQLCKNNKFILSSAFERLDRTLSRKLVSHDIIKFLQENSVYTVSASEADNLIKYYGYPYREYLEFADFIQIFLPCEDIILREITIDREPFMTIGLSDF